MNQQTETKADGKKTEVENVSNTAELGTSVKIENVTKVDKAADTISEQEADKKSRELSEKLQPLIKEFALAGAKMAAKQTSEITGYIWDEFNKLSRAEKILALLLSAVVVGAVGYGSWKLIAGNWPKIKEYLGQMNPSQVDTYAKMAHEVFETLEPVKKLAQDVDKVKEIENPEDISKEEAKKLLKNVCQSGSQSFILGFIESLKNKEKK